MIGAVLGLALAATQPGPTLYDQAVSARRAGRDEQAVPLLERTIETEPGNADVWVQYGFALRNVGRTAEARQAFERALALAPEYQDARDGLASLETVTTPPVILSVDGTLTNVRAARDWRDARIAVSIPMGTSAQRIELSIEENKRFGRHDTYGELRFDHRVDDVTSYYLFAGGTAGADFRPRWQIGIGGAHRVSGSRNATLVTLDSAVARYPDGTTSTISPGIQQYLASGRVWISGKMINIFSDGDHRAGGLGRIDWQTSKNSRIFAGAARAPDLSAGTPINTTSLFAGGSLAISSQIDWRISLAHDDPSTGPTRTGLSTGFSVKF